MKIWKVSLLLITIGLLLSFSQKSQSSVVTLTPSNHVVFAGPVNDESVAAAQVKLAEISAELSSSDVIYLVIDSPGGSVPAGNRFIDFASSIPQRVKTICLFCASMGYHIFQSLDERLVYSSSELMSHRVRIGGLSGQIPGEAVTRLNDIIAVSNKMDSKVAKRVGLSLAAYQKLIYDELWLDGETAVATNHADRVAKIRCSKELIYGTLKNSVNTMFGKVEVTISSCPLITGFLNVELKRESKFRSVQEATQYLQKQKRKVTVQF